MNKIVTSVMALALSAASFAPASAAVRSTNYLVTVTAGRGVPVGSSQCFKLTQTGGVLGFVNSGTISSGDAVGNYYVFKSVLTAEIGGFLFTGTLMNKGIVNTSFSVFGSEGITGLGAFSAVQGGC